MSLENLKGQIDNLFADLNEKFHVMAGIGVGVEKGSVINLANKFRDDCTQKHHALRELMQKMEKEAEKKILEEK